MTVLIVEDHEDLRRSLVDLVQSNFPETGVKGVGSGDEAVEWALNHQPDLVLMDIQLPGIDGIEACRRITNSGCDAKVIFLTVHDEMSYRIDAASVKASAFLSKLNAYQELVPLMRALLKRRACTEQSAGTS